VYLFQHTLVFFMLWRVNYLKQSSKIVHILNSVALSAKLPSG